MPNPAIPRDQVHELSEACSDEGLTFQATTAPRLVKQQRRLSRFFEQNGEPLGPVATQVALYMLTVCMRVFEQSGGQLRKVNGADLQRAQQRVQEHVEALMPADEGFGARAKEIADRAQPHLLDEVIWALYEREDEEGDSDEAGEDGEDGDPAGQADLDPETSALIYLLLWTAVEALDANWRPPRGFGEG